MVVQERILVEVFLLCCLVEFYVGFIYSRFFLVDIPTVAYVSDVNIQL